jgi:hypothetical protein
MGMERNRCNEKPNVITNATNPLLLFNNASVTREKEFWIISGSGARVEPQTFVFGVNNRLGGSDPHPPLRLATK